MHQSPSNFSTMHIFTNTPSSHSKNIPKQRKTKKNPNLEATFDLGVCDATGIACTYSIARPRSSSSSAHAHSLCLSLPTHSRARHTNAQNPNFSVPGTLIFLGFSASKKLVSWILRQKKKDLFLGFSARNENNFLGLPPAQERRGLFWCQEEAGNSSPVRSVCF